MAHGQLRAGKFKINPVYTEEDDRDPHTFVKPQSQNPSPLLWSLQGRFYSNTTFAFAQTNLRRYCDCIFET